MVARNGSAAAASRSILENRRAVTVSCFFFIKFVPVDLLCFDFVKCISVTSTLWCEVTASDGSTLHVLFPWHGRLLFSIHNLIYRDFISITALCY